MEIRGHKGGSSWGTRENQMGQWVLHQVVNNYTSALLNWAEICFISKGCTRLAVD